MTIDYRICSTHDQFLAVAGLEQTIWDVIDADVITPHMLHVISHIGGLILGAFDGDTMIGMAVATPMQEQGLLWSHMAGVLPDYQTQGIGYEIKQQQRAWAIENGYSEIHWSFDPAMRRNAKFNFRKLGVITNCYHQNFYGEMTDGINAGVSSDRFEAIWQLNQPRTEHTIPENINFLLRAEGNQLLSNEQPMQTYHAVACPYDFPAIKAQSNGIARAWRQMMARVLQAAFAAGYYVVDFVTDNEHETCYYVLYHPEN